MRNYFLCLSLTFIFSTAVFSQDLLNTTNSIPECLEFQNSPLPPQTVDVADLNNPPDPRLIASNDKGTVRYFYRIGKFEVTNGEYVTFLNAVAQNSDPHALYNPLMSSRDEGGIERYRVGQKFYYCAKANFENKPVNFISWLSAARFVNYLTWLQDQADGLAVVDISLSTESGSYPLTGDVMDYLNSHRTLATAKWVIPNMDEWYKAAFYDPTRRSLGYNNDYWIMATRSDRVPTPGYSDAVGNLFSPAPNLTSVINFDNQAQWGGRYQRGNVSTVGTSIGSSYYGAYDMNGNVSETTENLFFGNDGRQIWGGSFLTPNYVVGNSPLGSHLRIVTVPPINVYTEPQIYGPAEREWYGVRVAQIFPPARPKNTVRKSTAFTVLP